MIQESPTQVGFNTSWPGSLSEILQIFGPLNDQEFRNIINLMLLGGGIINKSFNFPNTVYQKINQELRDKSIHYNLKSNKWITNNYEYSELHSSQKRNEILVNWKGSTFGKGQEILYILIDNRCLSDLIIKKSTKHFIKIGKTSQKLQNRIRDLNTGNPYGLRPIITLKLDNALVLERRIQNDLNKFNVKSNYANNQEWFYVESETLIASLVKNL